VAIQHALSHGSKAGREAVEELVASTATDKVTQWSTKTMRVLAGGGLQPGEAWAFPRTLADGKGQSFIKKHREQDSSTQAPARGPIASCVSGVMPMARRRRLDSVRVIGQGATTTAGFRHRRGHLARARRGVATSLAPIDCSS